MDRIGNPMAHSMVTHYHYHTHTYVDEPQRRQRQAPPLPHKPEHLRTPSTSPLRSRQPSVAPSVTATPPPVRPNGFVSGWAYDVKQRWIGFYRAARPIVAFMANCILIALDFVLTRVSIGFLFRPIGGG